MVTKTLLEYLKYPLKIYKLAKRCHNYMRNKNYDDFLFYARATSARRSKFARSRRNSWFPVNLTQDLIAMCLIKYIHRTEKYQWHAVSKVNCQVCDCLLHRYRRIGNYFEKKIVLWVAYGNRTSGPPTSGPPTSGPPTSGPPTSGPPTSGPPVSQYIRL